jgi:hypothetical protein
MVRTISLHGCGTSGGISLRAQQKKKKEKKKKKTKKKPIPVPARA